MLPGIKSITDKKGDSPGTAWRKSNELAKAYFKEKGVDENTIKYWRRPESPEEHQENPDLNFVYTEKIAGTNKFNFKLESSFDSSKIKLSPETEKERERKWSETLKSGKEFFKGVAVKGNTPEEREKYIKETTLNYLKSDKSQPIGLYLHNNEYLVWDGAHRAWVAKKLNIPLKAYVVSGEKLSEAVIIPGKIKEERKVSSFDELVEYGKVNDFDVVEYDEFFETLSDNDRKTAPPKGAVPFFALFSPLRKRAMFVINAPVDIVRRIPNFKEIVDDIIGHEKVHGEQNIRRKGLTFNLPSPTERKKYFSNKDEIMAFSWSIANGLSKKNKTIQDAFQDLDKNKWGREEHFNLWSSVKAVCDEKVINRYKKYIYMYLDKILNKD